MNIRILAIVSAAFAAITGLASLLVPEQFLAPYGVTTDEAGIVIARLLGAHLVPIAALDWLARNDLADGRRGGARMAIVVANIITPALSLVVVALAMAAGIVNQLGWGQLAVLVLLVIGWVYYGLMDRGGRGS